MGLIIIASALQTAQEIDTIWAIFSQYQKTKDRSTFGMRSIFRSNVQKSKASVARKSGATVRPQLKIMGSSILRTFSCCHNPLDIFDGYVDFQGTLLHSCRRWYGQSPTSYGDFHNSRVIFRGEDIDGGDDPRIATIQGRVCLVAVMYSKMHGFRNHLLTFKEDGSWDRHYLMPPLGIDAGKNWAPFERPDGRLAFIHSFSPLRILTEIRRERGIILLEETIGEGIPVEEGDGYFPAFRGGSNGVMVDGKIVGIGHTTRRAYDRDGEPVIDNRCYYDFNHQLIHRPFVWQLDMDTNALSWEEIDYEWDPRYWIIDPTSVIWWPDLARGVFFTTEVERNFADPTSAARTVKYEFSIL